MKSKKWYWLTAVSLFMVMMINCGVGFYSLSLFVDPIADAFCITKGDVALLYTFYSLGSALAAVGLHRILKKVSLRTVLLLGGILSTGGYMLFVAAGSLRVMFLGGILIGASTVFAGTAVCQLAIAKWFLEKRSMITGIVAAASGVGTAVGGPVIGAAIRQVGWRQAFLLIGGMVFFFVFAQVFVIFRSSPADVGVVPYGVSTENVADQMESEGVPLRAVVKTRCFFLFTCGMLITSLIYQVVSLYQSSILLERGYSAELAAVCLSVFAIFDMSSKALSGIVADRRGFRTVTCYCALALAAAFIMIRCITSALGAFIFSALLGFWPTILVLYGVTVSIALFGRKYLAEYISYTQTVMCCCSMIGMPVIRALYNMKGGFSAILDFALALVIVFLAIMLLLLRPSNLAQNKVYGGMGK